MSLNWGQEVTTYCKEYCEEPDALIGQVRFCEGLELRSSVYSTRLIYKY